MKNYHSKEQLNKITQSFSQIFDIKLSKVRHKVALKEGFKCHEAHLESLPNEIKENYNYFDENEAYTISDVYVQNIISSIQKRTGMYFNRINKNIIFNDLLDTFTTQYKSKYSSKINIKLELNDSITISDDSKNLDENIFIEKEKNNIFNDVSLFHKMGNKCKSVNNLTIKDLFLINAISSKFNFCYKTDDNFYNFSFENGILQKKQNFNKNVSNGMHINFKLKESFIYDGESKTLSIKELKEKIKQTSNLNKGLDINLNIENKNYNYLSNSYNEIFLQHFQDKKLLKNKITIAKLSDTLDVKAIIVDTKSNVDLECFSYINDRFVPEGGSHKKGFEKFLKENYNKYFFNEELKGLKIILLVDIENFELSRNQRKVISRKTTKEVFNLMEQ